MKQLVTLALLAGLATAAQAQGPGGAPRPQLPDHWLTLDSLSQAVALTAEQRDKVTPPYTALNNVMKQAAAKRNEMRQRMMAGGAGAGAPSFQEMTPEQRQAMRARMDSARAELQPLQDEVDQWYQAVRALLTPEQQGKFDALPKPVVVQPMGRGGRGPGQD
jgi:hypothetical protein